MPSSRSSRSRDGFIEELGLHADWEDFREDYNERQGHLDRYLADPPLRDILGSLKIPELAWRQIVDSAVYEADFSARQRSPVICSVGRKLLIQRLVEIDAPAMRPTFSGVNERRFVDFYSQDAGLALRPKSLEKLMEVKQDADVRKYGGHFIEVVTALPSDELMSRRRVRQLVRQAIDTKSVASLFSGALRWGGRVLGLAHSPLALVATAGSYLAARHASSSSWYEFSGSVDHAVSLAAFSKNLDDDIKE
jgi:hypothetical protein